MNVEPKEIPVSEQPSKKEEKTEPNVVKEAEKDVEKELEKEESVDIKTLLKTMRKQQNAAAEAVREESVPYRASHPEVPAEVPANEANDSNDRDAVLTVSAPMRMDFTKLTVMGTLFSTYIMASDGQFFYLID